MDVITQRGDRITLMQADFKGSGGEGAVYVRGGTAYKVYADGAKVIPEAKIRELSVLDRPQIVRPKDLLLNASHQPVGYTMDAIPAGFPLGQSFTPSFRNRHLITPDIVVGLVLGLRNGVDYVHRKGILIVDINESNFLLDDDLTKVYFIDVDSYQTPNFPATALLDSVRDRQSISLDAGSDWFSFAVVSFQMFIGIHPYRGRHARLTTLDSRMQANVSVFSGDVTLPSVCLPFSVIPQCYREWYHAVLDLGQRMPPPETADSIIVLRRGSVRMGERSRFCIDLLQEFASEIVGYLNGAVATADGVCVGVGTWPRTGTLLGTVPYNDTPVAVWLECGRVRLYDLLRGHEIAADITAEALVSSDGRTYAKRGGALYELMFTGLPAGTLVSQRLAGAVPERSTHLFTGVAFLDLLGSWYASLLAGKGAAPQIRLPELDSYALIDARYQNRVLIVTAERGCGLDKFVFRFAENFRSYDVRMLGDVSTGGVNMTVLDNGVCLYLTADDQLEVFSNRAGDAVVNLYDDPEIRGDCTLYKNGSQALFARGRKLYRFSSATT